jgi:predicted glycogen debranching enzyme
VRRHRGQPQGERDQHQHEGIAAAVEGGVGWYLNFEFDVERERGLDFQEDLFNPAVLTFTLTPGRAATVIASLEERSAADAPHLRRSEIARRARIAAAAPIANEHVQRLAIAADQFLVKRGQLKTIIAGYPWFSDWGRDSMIALPGLTLVTGRYEVARDILQAFADAMSEGMLPNRFPDAGDTPEYNTVDATLWFFEAVRAFVQYTGDYTFVRDRLYPRLKESIDWHLRGTRYGIHVENDGLLACGVPGSQLTWMDARIGDWVVTPRQGKPVEVQALWYNALRTMQDLAARFEDPTGEQFVRELANLAMASFNRLFWNESDGCLFDVVNGDERDASMRPNQIFAVSLHHSVLHPDRAKAVVDAVERSLLTPLGLRSLAATDRRYRPTYEGGVAERDSAYHQGTVWPWLMGPFLTAYVKVNGRTAAARARAASCLEGLEQHLHSACLGHISEIADAEPPHRPRGCFAQAWSVAELLRAAVEEVFEDECAVRQLAAGAA